VAETASATPTCPIVCVRQSGCFRWELIAADLESGLVTFTWRLTNTCRGRLGSAEFLFTHGHPTIVGIQTGQTYVSPGGSSYTVQVGKGSMSGIIFDAGSTGTIRNGESDLFIFTATESGIDSATYFWNNATTIDGEREGVDLQVEDCPAGCPPPDPVRNASAHHTVRPDGDWDIRIRWNVHPWSSLKMFNLYRVRSGLLEMSQVNTAPVRPDVNGKASVDDIVASGMLARYRIQPLDASGKAAGPAVLVQVEAAPSLLSLGTAPLLLILLGLGSGIAGLRRRGRST
jgi:hypothetical protein